ncbi:hypothetical protein [Undibacterium rugosum]|uniref:Uncharacterized protein n=1 Tax=Undibacterium rugosum TaxID=2762291 RepID=A0A923I2M4_9BURK|nr:hypothetical protein [Undibacterium rugosum]MBC3936556.1 hypothetical protein [Undibacterium rugosum]MBR7779813.1 hypothetical protein [Undibacterium rugosum]
MSTINQPATDSVTNTPERRNHSSTQLRLVELDPRLAIAGEIIGDYLLLPDIQSVGSMRECCPFCGDEPLQLHLRYRHVKRSHLFCNRCHRCYDALHPDGSSAIANYALLTIPSVTTP